MQRSDAAIETHLAAPSAQVSRCFLVAVMLVFSVSVRVRIIRHGYFIITDSVQIIVRSLMTRISGG